MSNHIFSLSKKIEHLLLVIFKFSVYSLLLTPLIISRNFFFPFVAPKTLYFFGVAEVIIFVYLILAVSFSKYRPKLNILLVGLSLFLVSMIISTVFGVCPAESFWSKYERMTGLLMWFHLFGLFVATSSVFKKEDWIKVFEVSIIIAAIVGSLAILTAKHIGPLAKAGLETRGGGTLGNSSFLASYLLFNAFLGIYLFFELFEQELRILFGIFSAIVIISLFLSTGRAAAISFVGGLVLLFLLWCIYHRDKKLKIAGISLLIIFSCALVLAIYSSLSYAYFGQKNIIQREILDKVSLSISKDRALVWNIGIRALKERPLFGWGPENFNIAFTKYFDPRLFIREEYGNDIWFDRAHNIIVDTLVAMGMVGFLVYLLFFLSVFWILWKKYYRQELDFLTVSLFSVTLLAYFIQNLTVFDMVASYMMFFVVLGFVGSIASQKENIKIEEGDLSFNRIGFMVGFVVFSLALGFSLFYFVIQPARSNMTLIKAVHTEDSKERIDLYKESLSISPMGKFQMRENIASQEMAKYKIRPIVEAIPLEDQKRELTFLAQGLEENIKESPLLFSSYLLLGSVYNIYSRIDYSALKKAEEVLNKAIEISPGNQQAYWALAQTKMFEGKFDEAFLVARKSVLLAPRAEQSNMIMVDVGIVIAKATGNQEYMKRAIKTALDINPKWANDIQNLLNQRGLGVSKEELSQ
ncbi:O-antigen ligase family protein [bacterium]|nr:O-antigen ligase family protein [bacterium]